MPSLVEPVLPAGSLNRAPQPTLAGDGVVLRPFADGDAPALVDAYDDPAIRQWHCRTVDAREAVDLVQRWRSTWAAESAASWAVVAPDDGVLLGRAGFRGVDLDEGRAEVAYWVLPAARRRGMAVASVAALVRWAFDDVGFHRLELLHSTANEPSCGVARRAGFTLEGTLRAAVLHADGWHDMHLHARVRPVH